MKKQEYRITKNNKIFYPEYYHNSFFGKWFSGWRRYETDELCLNGYFTTLEKYDISFTKLSKSKKFINKEININDVHVH
jgi:hypothetical protein